MFDLNVWPWAVLACFLIHKLKYRYTQKEEIQALLRGVRFLVQMLTHWAIGHSWELGHKLGSCVKIKYQWDKNDRSVNSFCIFIQSQLALDSIIQAHSHFSLDVRIVLNFDLQLNWQDYRDINLLTAWATALKSFFIDLQLVKIWYCLNVAFSLDCLSLLFCSHFDCLSRTCKLERMQI